MLTAGSALFIPAGYWHAVESLDTTISVAVRAETNCQLVARKPDDFLAWLHERGLYRAGNGVLAD